MVSFNGRKLTVPLFLSFITFLAYSSQYLFLSLEPQPLSLKQTISFNINFIILLICYARTLLTDPGRIPPTESPLTGGRELSDGESRVLAKQRWCRVCNQRKPPRSHHCRICKRYSVSICFEL
jgi:palmitoyltransferase